MLPIPLSDCNPKAESEIDADALYIIVKDDNEPSDAEIAAIIAEIAARAEAA